MFNLKATSVAFSYFCSMDIQEIIACCTWNSFSLPKKNSFQKKNLLKIVAVETAAVTKLFNIP
jgi:hypothetical protein